MWTFPRTTNSDGSKTYTIDYGLFVMGEYDGEDIVYYQTPLKLEVSTSKTDVVTLSIEV
jgi:hypothetical protein